LWFVWHFIDFLLTFLSLYLGSGLHRNCCILTFLSQRATEKMMGNSMTLTRPG